MAEKKFCYISRIKEGVLNGKNKKFNNAYKVIYGVDAITRIIQKLIVEKKIKVIGKKIYLIGEHDE